MKIRNGFVSNSSSSSFCILGVTIDEDVGEEVDAKSEVCHLEYGIENYFNETLIGASPSQMKDDETLAEFKKRVADDINKHAGKELCTPDNLSWCTDGGYEG